MESVYITPMTKELARQFYREFVLDPDLFADKSKYQPFLYSDNFSDTRVERYARMGRIFMASNAGSKTHRRDRIKEYRPQA